MRTVTATTTAWITNDSIGPKELRNGDDAYIVNRLVYYDIDMTSSGWTKAGTATITLEIADDQALIDSKLASLQAELQKVRADAVVAESRILDRIQNLKALTYVEQPS